MKRMWVWVFVIVILIGSIVATVYFYTQYRKVSGLDIQQEINSIVAKVNKIMILPDEMPTIATVTDNTKLADQVFFRNAQNGDKVLIYSKSSRAILYRPKNNKIIEVASVLPADNVVVTPTDKKIENAKIVLLNGTKILGLTSKLEKIILEKVKAVEVVGKESASQTDYEQTVVVDVSNKFKDKVEELKNILGATVMSIPVGENASESDILVILGKNLI